MAKLPLQNNFAPVTNQVTDILGIMDNLNHQQKSLTNLLGQTADINNMFSSDLVSFTQSVDTINSQAGTISKSLTNQQQLLNTIQTSAVGKTASVLKDVSSEITQMGEVTSLISDHTTNINSLVSAGVAQNLTTSAIQTQITSLTNSISSTVTALTTSLTGHNAILTSVLGQATQGINGIITGNIKSPIGNLSNGLASPSTADPLKSVVTTDFTDLSSFNVGAVVTTVSRLSSQISQEVATDVGGALDKLRTTVSANIAANTPSLASVTNDIKGAATQATTGLSKLTATASQLGDVSSKLTSLTTSVSGSLTSLSGPTISTITSQLSDISKTASNLQSTGQTVISHVDALSTTINTSITGSVSDLSNISSAATNLSGSVFNMNNLGHQLEMQGVALSDHAIDLPPGNVISELSDKVAAIGAAVKTQTATTPDYLDTLATHSAQPDLNIGIIEQSIANSGTHLAAMDPINVNLNIDVNSMSTGLVNQMLQIDNSNAANTISLPTG